MVSLASVFGYNTNIRQYMLRLKHMLASMVYALDINAMTTVL
jgi:hypothetical protein